MKATFLKLPELFLSCRVRIRKKRVIVQRDLVYRNFKSNCTYSKKCVCSSVFVHAKKWNCAAPQSRIKVKPVGLAATRNTAFLCLSPHLNMSKPIDLCDKNVS